MSARYIALVALGVVALGWAAVVAWETLADPYHREYYAGPGVWAEVQSHGVLRISKQPGEYFRMPLTGLHEITVVVLAAAGAALVAVGLTSRRRAVPSTQS